MASTSGISNSYQVKTTKEGLTTVKSDVDKINIDELTDSLINVKKQTAQKYEDQIIINIDKKIPAIEELRSKVSALETSLAKLTNDLSSNYTGINSAETNALNTKTATVKKGDEAISFTINSSAKVTLNDVSMTVLQVASTDRIQSTFSATSTTSPVGFSGNFVINNQTIAITNDSTLNSIFNDISNIQSLTNVSPSISKVSETQYQLCLTALNLAEPINFNGTTGTDASLLDLSGLMFSSTPTDPETLTDSKDHIESGYTGTSSTDTVNFSGNFVINNQTIAVTDGVSTLDSIRDDINLLTKKTKVTATISFDSEMGTYKLVLDATEKASPINLAGTVGTDSSIQTGLGIPTENTDIDTLLAKYKLNSDVINTRKSNKISDAGDEFNGITFLLKSVSTTTPVPIPTIFSIDYDKTGAVAAIQDFVTKYNDVIDAVNVHKKTQSDGKTPDENATLFNSDLLRSIQSMLENITNVAAVGTADEDYCSVGDIGLNLNSWNSKDKKSSISGKLNINTEEFQKAIYENDFSRVIKLFGNFASSSVSNFYGYSMPDTFPTTLAGQAITLTYQYDGATSTDIDFSTNFEVPQPTEPLGKEVAGQLVTLTYSLNEDETYSATIQGSSIKDSNGNLIIGTATVTGDILTFSSDSIYKGLVINIKDVHPTDTATPITNTFTLPQFKATLSSAGRSDVVINNIQLDRIVAPNDTIYKDLIIGYSASGNTNPLSMGQSIQTTLKLTQGIAVAFDKLLTTSVQKYNPSLNESPSSLFDVAIQKILNENKTSQQQIDNVQEDADRIMRRLAPQMDALYKASYKAQSISLMLETQRALLFGD